MQLQRIEGTVNRILLILQAGPNELCDNIRFQVKCSSMLLSVDGNTAHLNADASGGHEEKCGERFSSIENAGFGESRRDCH